MSCVLVFLTRDEGEEDLHGVLKKARELALLWGAAELQVVRMVQIPPQIRISDLDPANLVALVDPEGLINLRMVEGDHAWGIAARHRIVPSRGTVQCVLGQVEELKPAALVLIAEDLGCRFFGEYTPGRVMCQARVPTVVLHRLPHEPAARRCKQYPC